MAWYGDDDYEYYVEGTGEKPDLEHILWSGSDFDPHAQQLFNEAFFEGDARAYQNLIDWLWDNYEIDFEDAFDWADFRSWYDAA